MDKNLQRKQLVERLADSSTALVCNAYDFMGLHSPCTDRSILCQTPELPLMVGAAITISIDCSTPPGQQYFTADDTSGDPEGNLYQALVEMIEKSTVPCVVVIQSLGNYEYGAVLGDGMAKTMVTAGAVGVVTNGPVRDLRDIKKVGLNVFAGGVTPNHHALRWSGLGKPVSIGGLEIHTGDILHGDSDGVITLPEDGLHKVVRACRYVLDFEKKVHVVMRRTDISMSEKITESGIRVDEYRKLISDISGFEDL